MKLKEKILLGHGIAFALMGMVVAWAVTNLVSLGKATNAILSENYRSILAAENMVGVLERQDSGILLMFLGNAEKGIAQFRENEAVFLSNSGLSVGVVSQRMPCLAMWALTLAMFLGRLEFIVVIVSLLKLGRDVRLMLARTH